MTINTKIKKNLEIEKLKKVNTNRYRVSINKSLKNISAQIIDDKLNKTLVSASSIEKLLNRKKPKDGKIISYRWNLSQKSERKINEVYFDRGGYKYHGKFKIWKLKKKWLKFWWQKIKNWERYKRKTSSYKPIPK